MGTEIKNANPAKSKQENIKNLIDRSINKSYKT